MNNMDKWCMKWNEFDTNIREYLRIIREDQRLFDVTLVTDDGQHIEAHKIILSAGSHFFSNIFLRSNQSNMLIYLKGINSVQLVHLLDFIYNGEASVGQEELKEFLETGKELHVKGFEAYVSGMGESVQDESVCESNVKKEIYENRHNVISDALKPSLGRYNSLEGALTQAKEGKVKVNENTDLDLQISTMIEKSDNLWICKVCGKTTTKKGHIQDHAESHIEGMSHPCHICNKSFSNRPSLRKHIQDIHSELSSCDLCEKSGMNKKSYNDHKRKQHKTLSETLIE